MGPCDASHFTDGETERLGHLPDSTARGSYHPALLGLWLTRIPPPLRHTTFRAWRREGPGSPLGRKAPGTWLFLSSSSSLSTVANLECGPS